MDKKIVIMVSIGGNTLVFNIILFTFRQIEIKKKNVLRCINIGYRLDILKILTYLLIVNRLMIINCNTIIYNKWRYT